MHLLVSPSLSGGWAKRLLKGLVPEILIIQDNLLRKRMWVSGNVIVENPQEPCRRHLSGQSVQPRTTAIWHLLQVHMTENQWWWGSFYYISCLFRGSGVINNVEMSARWKLRSIATNMLSPSRHDQKRPGGSGGRGGDQCQFRSWNKLPLLSALHCWVLPGWNRGFPAVVNPGPVSGSLFSASLGISPLDCDKIKTFSLNHDDPSVLSSSLPSS